MFPVPMVLFYSILAATVTMMLYLLPPKNAGEPRSFLRMMLVSGAAVLLAEIVTYLLGIPHRHTY